MRARSDRGAVPGSPGLVSVLRMDLPRVLDVATSLGASAARLGAGMAVGGVGKRPAEPLALYEFEACPFCRKVREALSILDLDAASTRARRAGRASARRCGGAAARRSSPTWSIPTPGRRCTSRTTSSATCSRRTATAACRWTLALGRSRWSGSALASAWRVGHGERYRPRARARAAARALELRGVAVLPSRARGAVRARAAVSPAQRRARAARTATRSSRARAR